MLVCCKHCVDRVCNLHAHEITTGLVEEVWQTCSLFAGLTVLAGSDTVLGACVSVVGSISDLHCAKRTVLASSLLALIVDQVWVSAAALAFLVGT